MPSLLIKRILCVAFLFPTLTFAAHPSGWPKHRLRGSNVFANTSSEDLRDLAQAWGANSARILEYGLLSMKPPHALDEAKLNNAFKVVGEGMRQGLFMIIGLGAAMEDNDLFFRSTEFKQAYVNLWNKIATRYREHGTTLAYDLMNEPHDSVAEKEWSKFARELTQAIREIDTRHTIIVEPPNWGWPHGFPHLTPTGDQNTVYSFHFYGPMDLTHLRGYDSEGKFVGHLKATEQQWNERRYPGWITDGLEASGMRWTSRWILRSRIAPHPEARQNWWRGSKSSYQKGSAQNSPQWCALPR